MITKLKYFCPTNVDTFIYIAHSIIATQHPYSASYHFCNLQQDLQCPFKLHNVWMVFMFEHLIVMVVVEVVTLVRTHWHWHQRDLTGRLPAVILADHCQLHY